MDTHHFFSRYDHFIVETLEHYHIPGVSIAVVDGDSTWAKGYGKARLPNEEVTTSTLFNGGSTTKALIAACISLLVDETSKPDVQWSTPVSHLLRDDFVLADSRTEMVTIEDILSHRSGFPDHDDACLGIHAKSPDTPRSVTRKLRHLPLTAPLRAEFQYSNMMYVVAAHLVETLSGVSIADFLRQEITEPLGMEHTYLGHDEVIAHQALDRLARGYGWDDDKHEYFEIDWPIQPEAVGAGEIMNTASDFVLFLRCMIHQTLPLSAAGHKELVKPRMIVDSSPEPHWSQELYALGWSTSTYHGEVVIDHSGSTSGFGCHMVYLPGRKWGMMILGNSGDGSSGIDKIMWRLVDDLLCIPQEKRVNWSERVGDDETNWRSKAVNELYPKIPEPPIPLTLPITSYTGSYQHKGYGEFVVDLKDGKLEIDAPDRTYPFKLFLTHISGEFFAAERMDTGSREKEISKAAFRLNQDGSVDQFGVALIPDLERELIWFNKHSEHGSRE